MDFLTNNKDLSLFNSADYTLNSLNCIKCKNRSVSSHYTDDGTCIESKRLIYKDLCLTELCLISLMSPSNQFSLIFDFP